MVDSHLHTHFLYLCPFHLVSIARYLSEVEGIPKKEFGKRRRTHWKWKRGDKKTKSNINYRSLTQFKYAHFVRFKPSNDLSICKYKMSICACVAIIDWILSFFLFFTFISCWSAFYLILYMFHCDKSTPVDFSLLLGKKR